MTDPEKKEARSRTRSLVKVLTRDQILLLKKSMEKNGIGLLFLTALCTGLRQGELLSLRWQDLDMETRVLSIQRTVSLFPKSDFLEREIQPPQQRSIKIPAELVQHLQQHHQTQHEERQQYGKKWAEKHLIFSDERGNYLSPFRLKRRFSKALEDANLPSIPFHAVRHTTISLLLILGVEARVVQAMLGVKWLDTVTVAFTSITEKRQGSPASLERGGIAASRAVVAISIIAMKRTTIAHRDSFYAPTCGSQIKRSRCSC